MKVVGYTEAGALDRAESLVDLEQPRPSTAGRDLLVEVQAVSVNPVDCKIRSRRQDPEGAVQVLGWDAAGVVVEAGSEAVGFNVGDKVWYAGAIDRPGTNAEYHLVDSRIVGHAPQSVSTAAAAALPLTTLTAWEMLFDRLDVAKPVPGGAPAVVIIGGAGGVGSIAIQLLRAKTDLTVIATASRPETQDWVKELGAHHVIDHREPLAPQIETLGIGAPSYVFATNFSDTYVEDAAAFMAPQGRFGLIDDPEAFSIMPFKMKAISIHWEFMYARSLFGTEDIAVQRDILNEVAQLIDAGKIRSTVTETMGTINAANLKSAHALLETGKAKGKLVLEGF